MFAKHSLYSPVRSVVGVAGEQIICHNEGV